MLAQVARRAAPQLARRMPALRSLHATGARLADDSSAKVEGGMTFNFTLPSECLYSGANVEMVILPGSDGFFGVLPSHVPTIAELKPGVVQVQETAGGPLSKYFVSGGFASINKDSVLNVSVLEACAVDELDSEAVKTGLAQYQAAYTAASDDMSKAEAEIGVEVYQAMAYAIAEA